MSDTISPQGQQSRPKLPFMPRQDISGVLLRHHQLLHADDEHWVDNLKPDVDNPTPVPAFQYDCSECASWFSWYWPCGDPRGAGARIPDNWRHVVGCEKHIQMARNGGLDAGDPSIAALSGPRPDWATNAMYASELIREHICSGGRATQSTATSASTQGSLTEPSPTTAAATKATKNPKTHGVKKASTTKQSKKRTSEAAGLLLEPAANQVTIIQETAAMDPPAPRSADDDDRSIDEFISFLCDDTESPSSAKPVGSSPSVPETAPTAIRDPLELFLPPPAPESVDEMAVPAAQQNAMAVQPQQVIPTVAQSTSATHGNLPVPKKRAPVNAVTQGRRRVGGSFNDPMVIDDDDPWSNPSPAHQGSASAAVAQAQLSLTQSVQAQTFGMDGFGNPLQLSYMAGHVIADTAGFQHDNVMQQTLLNTAHVSDNMVWQTANATAPTHNDPMPQVPNYMAGASHHYGMQQQTIAQGADPSFMPMMPQQAPNSAGDLANNMMPTFSNAVPTFPNSTAAQACAPVPANAPSAKGRKRRVVTPTDVAGTSLPSAHDRVGPTPAFGVPIPTGVRSTFDSRGRPLRDLTDEELEAERDSLPPPPKKKKANPKPRGRPRKSKGPQIPAEHWLQPIPPIAGVLTKVTPPAQQPGPQSFDGQIQMPVQIPAQVQHHQAFPQIQVTNTQLLAQNQTLTVQTPQPPTLNQAAQHQYAAQPQSMVYQQYMAPPQYGYTQQYDYSQQFANPQQFGSLQPYSDPQQYSNPQQFSNPQQLSNPQQFSNSQPTYGNPQQFSIPQPYGNLQQGITRPPQGGNPSYLPNVGYQVSQPAGGPSAANNTDIEDQAGDNVPRPRLRGDAHSFIDKVPVDVAQNQRKSKWKPPLVTPTPDMCVNPRDLILDPEVQSALEPVPSNGFGQGTAIQTGPQVSTNDLDNNAALEEELGQAILDAIAQHDQDTADQDTANQAAELVAPLIEGGLDPELERELFREAPAENNHDAELERILFGGFEGGEESLINDASRAAAAADYFDFTFDLSPSVVATNTVMLAREAGPGPGALPLAGIGGLDAVAAAAYSDDLTAAPFALAPGHADVRTSTTNATAHAAAPFTAPTINPSTTDTTSIETAMASGSNNAAHDAGRGLRIPGDFAGLPVDDSLFLAALSPMPEVHDDSSVTWDADTSDPETANPKPANTANQTVSTTAYQIVNSGIRVACNGPQQPSSSLHNAAVVSQDQQINALLSAPEQMEVPFLGFVVAGVDLATVDPLQLTPEGAEFDAPSSLFSDSSDELPDEF